MVRVNVSNIRTIIINHYNPGTKPTNDRYTFVSITRLASSMYLHFLQSLKQGIHSGNHQPRLPLSFNKKLIRILRVPQLITPNGDSMLLGNPKRTRVRRICHLCKPRPTWNQQLAQPRLSLHQASTNRKCSRSSNTMANLHPPQLSLHMVNLNQGTVSK